MNKARSGLTHHCGDEGNPSSHLCIDVLSEQPRGDDFLPLYILIQEIFTWMKFYMVKKLRGIS